MDNSIINRPDPAILPDGTPNRLVNVKRVDGSIKEIRVLEGHIFVCQGCCCGNTDKGFPQLPLNDFKREWKERSIRRRVHLTITGCLGPCQLANVVLLIYAGESIWFHSINSSAMVSAIYDYIELMISAQRFLIPEGEIAMLCFNRYTFDNIGSQ
jgi:cobaltochelatase CobN